MIVRSVGRHPALRRRGAALEDRMRLLLAARIEARLRRSAVVRGAALVFHGVAPIGGDGAYEIDPAIGRNEISAAVGYLKHRYKMVTASELPRAASKRAPGEPLPVAITFDDDLPSHLEYAAPVLAEHGCSATAFLCDAATPFWWQLLQRAVDARTIDAVDLAPVRPPLVKAALEREQGAIQRLAVAIERLSAKDRDRVWVALRGAVEEEPALLGSQGAAQLAVLRWELGFHTSGHYLLTGLDDDALRRELAPKPLQGGELPRTLAYPHGKASTREAKAAREAGFAAAYTGYPTALTDRTDPFLIGRLQPNVTTVGRFGLALARALDDG